MTVQYDVIRFVCLTFQVAVLSQSCKVCNSGGRSQTILQLNTASNNRSQIHITSEDHELEKFSATYRNQHCFNSHPQHKLFLEILTSLVKNRLCRYDWVDHAPPESVLRVLICLRLLVREPLYQYMELVCSSYLGCGEQTFAMEKLVTMTSYNDVRFHAHAQTLVKLLSTRDSSVLLGALLALTSLAESSECKKKIGELSIVENLLVILQDYDLLSKRMSAELLRLLSPVRQVREQVRECEGLPVLLSLLHGEHLKLLWSVVWVLVQLCEEPDTSAEIRTWGGVQQLLHILDSERAYVSDRSSIEALCSANAAGRIQRQHVSEELSPQEDVDDTMSLQSACCAALTELVLDDTTAHQVVQENGVYVIAILILPQSFRNGPKAISLQCYAFRTLRFLFSMECNRHLFKRLFPTDLFELFIDVGHYVRDITVYEALQAKVSLYTEELDSLRENIETVDQNRPPLRVINGYSILDHLGTGAFGSVFKVRKQSGQNLLALKEVNLHNPAFGKDKKSRDSNVEKIVSELTIIKEQMTHPNVVKYYKTFLKGDRLYIVMELIEGVPLWDHFNSLKEKEQQFTEERLWNIFIQMCLALRYLHKEKRIVHRDLTPNNVMLGERDKVTITDFGLAKQKQENSKLTSVVGTILYSCPEIVKSEPYGEKADVWASGCILYQMATLRPPFYSSNMLSLATKIVEAVYEPVEEGIFSERVTDMIKCCLTTDADLRPDIVEVSSKISDIMMRFMDSLHTSQNALERRAERDRKRAQKYFLESHRCRVSCCHSSKDQEKTSTRTDSDESMVPYFSLGHSSNQSKKIPSQGKSFLDYMAIINVSHNICYHLDYDLCVYIDNGSDKDLDPSHTNISTPKPRPGKLGHFEGCSSFLLQLWLSGFNSTDKHVGFIVSAGICVSQRKVRQIDDPVQRLLVQLHKIIYITQLPPALQHSVKRRAIERFKKSLFHYESSPYNLKVELNKLLQGSPELMESGSASSDWWSLVQSFGGDHLGAAKQAGLGRLLSKCNPLQLLVTCPKL
uniref:Protein kinase domain-containing protein n=1 Tax=Oncorhynchus tshawytscha TaxID=74940 RepID=A0A8C8FIG6_ONCTS